ncbi:TolB family protein [Bacteroidota bacterium]
MRKVIILGMLILITALIGCNKGPNENSNNEVRTGPYLGYASPGTTPQVFAPGIISTEELEANFVAYPGGNELYFVKYEPIGNQLKGTIYSIKSENGEWGEPEAVSFSGTYEDGYLAIHPDGSRMYWQSNRPVDQAESSYTWNIWYVDRNGDGWSEPNSMGQPINGRNHTSGPSVTMDGTMYFTLFTIGGVQEIYRSEYISGEYQEPERLPDNINSARQQFDSYISPDESYLIFGSWERSDSIGNTDLYISFKDDNDNWTQAVNMGAVINTTIGEGSATVSPDGQYIFYSRYNNAQQMNLDIYWVESEYVNGLR